jgi:alkanesulfonate monooxygenase SsuD/methylene tetrahydromethanopterin reductase-like flavin-dependent oxidoreductase (luciferase family)
LVDIGIGLPNTVPGTEGRTLVAWAEQAEAAGFKSVGTIGRLVYPSYDDLIALAAAAAVTERVRLTTGIYIAPLHSNAALLAKQAASLDRLSGGRFVFGVGLGGRDEDYTASGLPTEKRGGTLNRQLEEMKRIWAGEHRGHAGGIGPEPSRPGGPELIIGGRSEPAYRRLARYGDGWMMGAASPYGFGELAAAAEQAWRDAGRSGAPRKLANAYFALGPTAREDADAAIKHYYGFLGEEVATRVASAAAVGEDAVREYVQGYEQAGCDELIFSPCTSDLDQIKRLAEVVG